MQVPTLVDPPIPPPASEGLIVLARIHDAPTAYLLDADIYIAPIAGMQREARMRISGPRAVEPLPHGFSQVQLFEPVQLFLEEQPTAAPGGLRGIENARLYLEMDAQNRVTARRETNPDGSLFAGEALEALTFIRLTYADRPVRIGESWEGEPFRWVTSPFGWVTANVRPRFTLVRVSEEAGVRRARIEWNATVEIEPFTVAGMTLAGEGDVHGFSEIDLADGVSGLTELYGNFGLRAAALSPGASTPITATVKLTHRITPTAPSIPTPIR